MAAYQPNILFCLLAVVLLMFEQLSAVVIGSDSLVTREALAVFPAGDSDNEMRGFASFDNGFSIGSGGSCLFNSFFPVSKQASLNGGTVTLNKDVALTDVSTLDGATIIGNNHALITTTSMTFVSGLAPGNVDVEFVTQVGEPQPIMTVGWSYDDNHVGVASFQKAFDVCDFDGQALPLVATTATDEFMLDFDWHPSSYYVAVAGDRATGNKDDFQIFSYNPATDLFTLIDEAKHGVDNVAVAWHPSGNYVALAKRDNSAEIVIYAFDGNTISLLTSLNLSPNANVSRATLDWDPSGDYLVVGTALAGLSELMMYDFDGATLSPGPSVNINENVTAVRYSPSGNFIAVGLSSGSERLRIYKHDTVGQSLTEETAARIGQTLAVLSVDWRFDTQYLAIGCAFGTGTEFRVYKFDSGSSSLSLTKDFAIANNVNSVRWSHDGAYLAVGDATNYASIFKLSSGLVPTGFTLRDIKVSLSGPLFLSTVVTCENSCEFVGHGHEVILQADGALRVAAGATLTLKDVTLKGLGASGISCVDDTGVIALENVRLVLDENFSFTHGSCSISHELEICGPHDFLYGSGQSSTVEKNTTLTIKNGTRFVYDPPTAANNLITLTDASSVIRVHNATLHASTDGWQLLKGTLEIEGQSTLSSDATQESQGIIFGDGISASNDMTVVILPEANVRVLSGFVINKNVG